MLFLNDEKIQSSGIEPKSDFDSGFQSSHYKRIRLLSDPNQQGGDVSSSGKASPLGLTLRKTPSFLNLVEMKLSQARNNKNSTTNEINNHQASVPNGFRAKMDDYVSQPMSEKLKASNFHAMLLRIGSWERISRNEGHLTAKCYYAKRKIVWEVLDGSLKSKIEIQWTDIEAMRADIRDGEPGILEIELKQPPLFFRETNPQPRKHTLWQQAVDFTGGQAPICRRHYVKFAAGILDKHYEKLLQCDRRLFELSRRPFPKLDSLYFYPNFYGITDFSFDFNPCQAQVPPGMQFSFSPMPTSSLVPPPPPVHNLKPPTAQPISIVDSNSPMSVMDFPRNENQRAAHWIQEGNNVENLYAREAHIQGLAQANAAAFHSQGYQVRAYGEAIEQPGPNTGISLSDIEKHLLWESQAQCSDERLVARMRSVCSVLDNPGGHNVGMNQFEYKQENFSDDRLILGTSEQFEVDSSGLVVCPQPIHCLPSQVLDDDTVMQLRRENYRYVFLDSEVNGYAAADGGHEVHQWS